MSDEPKQYTLEELFIQIIEDITENKVAVRDAIKTRMSSQTFYRLLEDTERSKQYTRATEIRADKMADEILNISDSVEDDLITLEDGREIVNNNVIQRDRLRVDTRKWLLAKMHPKKYGDKLTQELTGKDGKDLEITRTIIKWGDKEIEV